MLLNKLAKLTAMLLVLALGIFTGGMLAKGYTDDKGEPAAGPEKQTGKQAAGPKKAEDNRAVSPKVLKLDGGGRRVAWSSDGKTLAVVTIYEPRFHGRKGSAIKLWNIETGHVGQTLAESSEGGLAFQHVVLSADGKTIAATVSEVIRKGDSLRVCDVVKVWDAKTLALKQTLGGDSHLVFVALSPDGKLVAAGDHGKKTIEVWNTATGKLERTLDTGKVSPQFMAFSPDSKTLFALTYDGTALIETVRDMGPKEDGTAEIKHTLKQDQLGGTPVLSVSGTLVACAGAGKDLIVWDLKKDEQILSLQANIARGVVALSPDGTTVAGGFSDHKVRLWDVPSGKLKKTLEGHESEIYALAFSPDGKMLASVSQDQTVRLWRIESRKGQSEDRLDRRSPDSQAAKRYSSP
jgi:WD40 repeat protein